MFLINKTLSVRFETFGHHTPESKLISFRCLLDDSIRTIHVKQLYQKNPTNFLVRFFLENLIKGFALFISKI